MRPDLEADACRCPSCVGWITQDEIRQAVKVIGLALPHGPIDQRAGVMIYCSPSLRLNLVGRMVRLTCLH